MPDGEVFTRRVTSPWRSLARALGDQAPASDCALELEGAITKHLRKTRGLEDRQLSDLLGAAGGTDPEQVVQALGELARRQAFERVVPLLVGPDRFPTFDKARAFINECLSSARLDVIARSLLRRPDGSRVARPPRPKSDLSALLGEAAPPGRFA